MTKLVKKPLRLSQKDFLESFRKVPRVAVNLIITDSKGKILLTKRNIPPFKNLWHYPGSYILKNELIESVIERIAKDELGARVKSKNFKLLNVFENITGDPRGHVIDLMYEISLGNITDIKPTSQTVEINFFEKDKLPSDVGFNHLSTLVKLGYKEKVT